MAVPRTVSDGNHHLEVKGEADFPSLTISCCAPHYSLALQHSHCLALGTRAPTSPALHLRLCCSSYSKGFQSPWVKPYPSFKAHLQPQLSLEIPAKRGLSLF